MQLSWTQIPPLIPVHLLPLLAGNKSCLIILLQTNSLIIGLRESKYYETKHAFLEQWLLTVFLRYVCFQGLIVTNLSLFIFSWFWNNTWQIPSYTHFLSFHPLHFCTKHWHSGLWRKPKERKGSVASCGGVEAWQFLGWNSNERPCSFLLPWMGCPPSKLEVWAMRAVRWECVCAEGGCHPAVTESAKYNITTVVGLCGLCVCSVPLRRKGLALPSVFPLSKRNTQHFSFIEDLTCLSENRGASSQGLM